MRKSIKEHFENISVQIRLSQFAVTTQQLKDARLIERFYERILWYADFVTELDKGKDIKRRAKQICKNSANFAFLLWLQGVHRWTEDFKQTVILLWFCCDFEIAFNNSMDIEIRAK